MPAIRIEQTPVNDLYLILQLLAPTPTIVRLLQDPVSFYRAHEESVRAVWQLVQGPVDEATPDGRGGSAPGPHRERSPAAPRRPARSDRFVSKHTSLLR
jgi:hypothetical protein